MYLLHTNVMVYFVFLVEVVWWWKAELCTQNFNEMHFNENEKRKISVKKGKKKLSQYINMVEWNIQVRIWGENDRKKELSS